MADYWGLGFKIKDRCGTFLSVPHSPYENMLIPLMIFLQKLNGNFSQMTEKQSKFIRFWYWASIFAQRYTGSSNEIIIQDALILSRIAKGGKITDRNYFYKLRSQVSSPDELHSFTKKGSAIYRGILNLINYHSAGLIDWPNTNKLSFNHSQLEDHHIFPRKYLTTNYPDNEEILSSIDSVVNKTLIPKLTNIKIGQKSPSIYLKDLHEQNPQLKQSLRNHVIPVELLEGMYDEDYCFFLEERADTIFQIIQANITDISEDIRLEFYQETRISQGNEKICVFAEYYERRIEADYHLATRQLLYQGKLYSPSGAAEKVKKEISGKDLSANGWEFWKFTDEQGQEKCILDWNNIFLACPLSPFPPRIPES